MRWNGSDVYKRQIVNGRVLGNMAAREYFQYKTQLIPEIKKAFRQLEEVADIIVIEGAGSPAEINLKENDIVNMGMAAMVDAPVLLVGDIDRGGVFAQLLGTLMLLDEEEKDRVKGLIINKFRGDKSILDPGIKMLEEKGHVPVAGVVPYMDIALEDEDSLTERFDRKTEGLIDIAVIRYPRIANFTDFNIFEQMPEVSVRYVTSVAELHHPDMVILPGTKNTMSDLKWMRQNGLEAAVRKLSEQIPVFGICGGYQMLGEEISDPDAVEEGGVIRGMELLNTVTILKKEKKRCQTEGALSPVEGVFRLSEMCIRDRAFTAQIIINHIQAREGEKIDNMDQALERAVANGVKNLVVQPTHLMHGAEYDEMVETVNAYQDKFESVKIAEPLLGEVGADATAVNEDKKAVAEILTAEAVKVAGFDSICLLYTSSLLSIRIRRNK